MNTNLNANVELKSFIIKASKDNTIALPNHKGWFTTYMSCWDFLKFSNDTNVRMVDPKASTVKAVIKTILEDSIELEAKSKGAEIQVYSYERLNDSDIKIYVRYDNLTNKFLDGILDGGHLQEACRQANEKESLENNPAKFKCSIRLCDKGENSDKITAEYSKALNHTTQVKGFTIENKKGSFDYLKSLLPPEYVDCISFIQNDANKGKKIDIEVFLKFFESYRKGSPEGGRATALKKFVEAKPDKYRSHEKFLNDDIISSIIEIYELFAESYAYHLTNRTKTGRLRFKKFDLLTNTEIDGTYKYTTAFYKNKLKVKIPEGWVIEMLVGFSKNLDENCHTIVPIKELFKRVEHEIWEGLIDNHCKDSNGKINVSCTTKTNSLVHTAVKNVVEKHVAQYQLEALK